MPTNPPPDTNLGYFCPSKHNGTFWKDRGFQCLPQWQQSLEHPGPDAIYSGVCSLQIPPVNFLSRYVSLRWLGYHSHVRSKVCSWKGVHGGLGDCSWSTLGSRELDSRQAGLTGGPEPREGSAGVRWAIR